MIELYVYNRSGTIIGEVSEYESLEIEKNFYEVSKLVLRAPKSAFNIDLLKIGNILSTKDEVEYGYIIEHFSNIEEGEVEIIEIFAYSLNWLLSYRSIPRQMRFTGDVTNVIANFVRYTCIDVAVNKVIPNLLIDANNPIGFNIDSSQTGGSVLSHIQSIAQEAESSVNVLLRNGNFYVNVKKGIDRSQVATDLPIVFSKDLDNVLTQEYYESYLDYKNVAVVAGQGEGINRVVVEAEIGNPVGLDRREIYVDARQLQSVYRDQNNNEVTLTVSEYEDILRQRGLEELRKYNRILNFESTVDDVQYKLGRDYFLGDKVTFLDRELNLALNSMVTKVTTTSDRSGVNIKPTFGIGVLNNIRRLEA